MRIDLCHRPAIEVWKAEDSDRRPAKERLRKARLHRCPQVAHSELSLGVVEAPISARPPPDGIVTTAVDAVPSPAGLDEFQRQLVRQSGKVRQPLRLAEAPDLREGILDVPSPERLNDGFAVQNVLSGQKHRQTRPGITQLLKGTERFTQMGNHSGLGELAGGV
jgi:hypothetical protein